MSNGGYRVAQCLEAIIISHTPFDAVHYELVVVLPAIIITMIITFNGTMPPVATVPFPSCVCMRLIGFCLELYSSLSCTCRPEELCVIEAVDHSNAVLNNISESFFFFFFFSENQVQVCHHLLIALLTEA